MFLVGVYACAAGGKCFFVVVVGRYIHPNCRVILMSYPYIIN